MEGTETEGTAERGRGGRGAEERVEEPEERAAVGREGGGGRGGRGGRGLSVVTRSEAGNWISSGNDSEMTEGEPTEAGRGTSSGRSSERMDPATTGGDICTKGVEGDLDSIEGVLVDGE